MTGPHKAVNGSKGAPQPRSKPEPPPDVPRRYTEGPSVGTRRLAAYQSRAELINAILAGSAELAAYDRDVFRPAVARLDAECTAAGHEWLDLWQPDGLGWLYDTCTACGAPRYRKPAADAANRSA